MDGLGVITVGGERVVLSSSKVIEVECDLNEDDE